MSFTPDRSPIASITNSPKCTVVTSVPHGLTSGQVVRLHVPKSYGMVELNQQLVSIFVFSPTVFNIQETQSPYPVYIDSTSFTPFVIPATSRFTAEVLPVGSGPTLVSAPEWAVTNQVFVTKIDDATTNDSTSPIPY